MPVKIFQHFSNLEEFEHLIAKLKKKSEVNPKDVALVKRKERKEKKKLAEAQVLKEKKGKVMAKKSRKRKAGKYYSKTRT